MLSIQKFAFNPIDQVLDTFNHAGRSFAWECYSPAADVRETKEGYVLDLDLPGLTEKDVEVTLEGKHLTIRGERKAPDQAGYTRVERGFGAFERVFHLPEDVDVAKIEAKARNGVLTVTLPRAESAKARTIAVKAE